VLVSVEYGFWRKIIPHITVWWGNGKEKDTIDLPVAFIFGPLFPVEHVCVFMASLFFIGKWQIGMHQ
jgi:hypothetical protein